MFLGEYCIIYTMLSRFKSTIPNKYRASRYTNYKHQYVPMVIIDYI